MAKKGKAYMLNRKQYERIRSMDHCTMSLWAESVYKSGYRDGEAAANSGSLTMDQVRDALIGLRGFGEKRVAAVCEELDRIIGSGGGTG